MSGNSLSMTCVLAVAAAWGSVASPYLIHFAPSALAQEYRTNSPSALPAVPVMDPRRLEGERQGERFKTHREGDADAPVASLLESVQGNDATLEVVVGQGRLLTLRQPPAEKDGVSLIAVGDPRVLEFEILHNPSMVRLLGRSAGTTDLSVMTADGRTTTFVVQVKYDLQLWEVQLRATFPDARVHLSQIQSHVVVEGEARSPVQVREILRTVEAFSSGVNGALSASGNQSAPAGSRLPPPGPQSRYDQDQAGDMAFAPAGEYGDRPTENAPESSAKIINLLRVPGVNQVMLQVRMAELNRTGMREIGTELGFANAAGNVIGTSLGGATVSALGLLGGGVNGSARTTNNASTTAFGVFPTADFEIFIRALRRNSLLTIMAEPNLVAMSGHEASFLAGGQFPVPVPQNTSGINNTITVQFKDFGVQLNFLPVVLDDDVIRLSVMPEVSSIDFALGTTLVVGGSPVPGLNTRRANTTVELRQGQTLAIAGLLQVQIDGRTGRIPGLGDLPYLGPLFSNTTHSRVEKELVVLVTPHLVSPLDCPPGPIPGEEVLDPSDWEFYLLNRIESRTGREFRSTTTWDDPQLRLLHLEKKAIYGPVGFSETP